MRSLRLFGLALLIGGFVLSLIAAFNGGFKFAFTWFFFLFQMRTDMAVVGALMMILGLLLMAISPFIMKPIIELMDDDQATGKIEGISEKNVRTAGVLFIGPIPILWGSDNRLLSIAAIVGTAVFVIMMVVLLLL
jgi:uncharacterized protein (TIGR00304 family)